MKAAYLTKNGFEIREIPVPQCGIDQVLIKSAANGICAGDVFAYTQKETITGDGNLLGHEGSGIVESVGKNVKGISVGDNVTADKGSFADYFTAFPESIIKVPDSINLNWALGEPVACCIHAMNRIASVPNEKIALIGCGYMGLVCMQILKARGAGFILAIDPVEERRIKALELGADEVSAPDKVEMPDDPFRNGLYDLVIEATGVPHALKMCGDLVKQHGSIELVGYHQSDEGIRNINIKQWNFKSINVYNGHVRRSNEKVDAMREGIAMMAEGKINMKTLVTGYRLDNADQAFEDFLNRKPGLFKAVLTSEV